MEDEKDGTFTPRSVELFIRDLNQAASTGFLEECIAYHRQAQKRFRVSDDLERIIYWGRVIVWRRDLAKYVESELAA